MSEDRGLAPTSDASTTTAVAAAPATAVRPLSFSHNVVWAFAGNLVYAASQWGMLVILAKVGSPQMVGQLSLGFAIVAPIIALANLRLRIVQSSEADGVYGFGDYLGLRLVTTPLAFAAIVGIVIAADYSYESSLVVVAVGLVKAFEAVSDVAHGALQRSERMDRVAQLQIAKGGISLAALALGLAVTRNLAWAVSFLAGVSCVLLLTLDLPVAVRATRSSESVFRPRWDARTLAAMARLALPLALGAMVLSLNMNLPRYFIEHYLGEYQLGIFSAMAYFLVAGRTVTLAIAQSTIPRLARLFTAGQMPAFRRILAKVVVACALVGASGVAVTAVAGRWILTVVYTPEYADHADVFILLMLAFALQFLAAAFRAALLAMRRYRTQLLLCIVSTVVLAAMCVALLESHGLRGAAWAIIGSRTVDLLLFAAASMPLLWRRRTCDDEPTAVSNGTAIRHSL